MEYTKITLTGATGSETTDLITGFITAFVVNYTDITSGTTAIAINQTIGGAVTETIGTITGNTDGVFRIEVATVQDDGSTATGQYVAPYVHNQKLTYSVTSSDAGTIEIWAIIAP